MPVSQLVKNMAVIITTEQKKMKEVKDFLGNPLTVGDRIVVTDKTYSKTPYLITGKITDIKFITTANGKSWRETVIYFTPENTSDAYLKELEDKEYDHNTYRSPNGNLGRMTFTIGKRNYINILKIS